MKILLVTFIMFVLTLTNTFAQTSTPEPELEVSVVEVTAADGLTLTGSYYPLAETPEAGAPAVLLLHMLNSRRTAWEPIFAPLHDAGYIVLNVDLRGHGDSAGERDWQAAQGDVQVWLDWLRQQPGVRADTVSVVGASVGANLALVGCANDAQCLTAVALSPGADYFGVVIESAVIDGLRERSALLVAAQDDVYTARSIKELIPATFGEIGVRLFDGRKHGTEFLMGGSSAATINMIINWLDEHQPL